MGGLANPGPVPGEWRYVTMGRKSAAHAVGTYPNMPQQRTALKACRQNREIHGLARLYLAAT